MKRYLNIPASVTFALLALASSLVAKPFSSDYLSVAVEGKGRDVVLIAGLACSPAVWDGLAPALLEDHRVHRVSITGFAGSIAPDPIPESILETLTSELERYVSEQKLDQPLFIGHSMGGVLSLMVARDKPDAVGQVVVVDALPFIGLMFNADLTVDAVTPRALRMEKRTMGMPHKQLHLVVQQAALYMIKTTDRHQEMIDWVIASDRTMYAQSYRELMTTDLRPDFPSITTPVHVFYAYDPASMVSGDALVKTYTDAFSGLPNKELTKIDGSYHFIMWDQPEVFEEAILAAIATE